MADNILFMTKDNAKLLKKEQKGLRKKINKLLGLLGEVEPDEGTDDEEDE